MRKNLDPNILPEKHVNPIKDSIEKSCTGQGRAGLRRGRSAPIKQTIRTVTENSWRDQNRNKKNKLCKFHRSNTFHKQC